MMGKGSGNSKIATPSSAGTKSSSTNYDPSGTILPVTNPIDIVYLCHKMEAAKKFPYECKDGSFRYQRQVTEWIRADAVNLGYKFPYCGEVGYDMTLTPPRAITSRTEEFRPSTWPISQYRVILREYRETNLYGDPVGSYLLDFRGVEVADPLVSKTELENTLSFKRSKDNYIVEDYRTLDPDIAAERFPNGRGMIRIPDVIKKLDYLLLGKEGYSPNNIDTVIEVKFPGDRLSREQRIDYTKIASNKREKFRLMTLKQCEYRRRRSKEEEEILANAKADPLYQVVGESAMANPTLALSIEQKMQMEYYAFSKHVIKWINQQKIEYSRPQMFAQDDNSNRQALQQAWQRYEQHHDMVLNAPLAAVGVAAIGSMAAVPLVASSAESLTVATVTRSGAEVIKFVPITRTAIIAGGGIVSEQLAAQNKPTNSYVLENNNQLTYYANFTEQEQLKYQDDRLIEIDYRYKKQLGQMAPLLDMENDSTHARQNRDKYRIDEYGRKIHYYPYRQQFYYYFTPGDEPTIDD